MNTYNFNASTVKDKDIYSGHIKTGTNKNSTETIEVNNYYISLNKQPFFVVAGEFHFSRYAHQFWKQELKKMKLAGINVVTTYVFWIHHEKFEGKFDWTLNNDLKLFVQYCKEAGLYVLLRIGPFCHGEVRNGGFPDWLYGKPFRVRSNDEEYLFYVKRLYKEIFNQIKGQLYKDNGPVIAVQLENEFVDNAGGPTWEITKNQSNECTYVAAGVKEHINTLKNIAMDVGIDVPFYTMTAWEKFDQLDGDILPMSGAYSFRPWCVYYKGQKHQPTDEYLIRNYHNVNSKIWAKDKYPYSFCELMGGMQNDYTYRFPLPYESVEALSITKIACGTNFLGYYMFHGGSNPIVNNIYMNETTTPKISYDYLAPLGEYGQIRDSYKRLKLIHLFCKEFENSLCEMVTAIPESNVNLKETDINTLRYSLRKKNNSGFLFLCNFQDHMANKDFNDIKFKIDFNSEDKNVDMPVNITLDLKKDVSAILPLNINLKGLHLNYSTTQFITSIDQNDVSYYFAFIPEGMKMEYCFNNNNIKNISIDKGSIRNIDSKTYVYSEDNVRSIIKITSNSDKDFILCTLTRQEALSFNKIKFKGKETIIISNANVVNDNDSIELTSIQQNNISFEIFPHQKRLTLPLPEESTFHVTEKGIFDFYNINTQGKNINIHVDKIYDNRVKLSIDNSEFNKVHDIFLSIDYVGDIGNMFIDSTLVSDNFYNGEKWLIGLKKFKEKITSKGAYFYISPLGDNDAQVIDNPMAMGIRKKGQKIAKINSIVAMPEYKLVLK